MTSNIINLYEIRNRGSLQANLQWESVNTYDSHRVAETWWAVFPGKFSFQKNHTYQNTDIFLTSFQGNLGILR